MATKKSALSEEARNAIFDAARAGVLEAYAENAGAQVNYFKATETLLYNYKKLSSLVADAEEYCDFEYHAGKSTFAATPHGKGFVERKTQEEIVEDMRAEREKSYSETRRAFEHLERTIQLFSGQPEFIVIRLYYFGEYADGSSRDTPATWEEIAFELSDAGILRDAKTARRWRNRIVNDMSVCIFGLPAAVGAGTYRK